MHSDKTHWLVLRLVDRRVVLSPVGRLGLIEQPDLGLHYEMEATRVIDMYRDNSRSSVSTDSLLTTNIVFYVLDS